MQVDDDKIHDFRKDKLGWGWNGINFKIIDEAPGKQKAEMLGIGKGIHKDEYIFMQNGGTEILWHIDDIEYHKNPPDMFDVKLTYAGVPA